MIDSVNDDVDVKCGSFMKQYDHNHDNYNQVKEGLSFAYLDLICAYIGAELNHSGRMMDNTGVDVTISLPRGEGRPFPLHLDAQLKCTTVPKYVENTYLSYRIDRGLFEGLCSKNKSSPWLLFVLILPPDVRKWVSVNKSELMARGTMLWYDATGQVTESDGKTISVRIPLINTVNKDSLYRLITKQLEVEG